MYLKDIIFIFNLITYMSSGESSYCHCKEKNIDRNGFQYDFGEYENNKKCNYMPEYSEVVVNNYENTYFNSGRYFSSACVQCLLCQTIARELQKMLTYYNKNLSKVIYNSREFNNSLKNFCDIGFKNFDLREQKGIRFIEQSSKSSRHVHCGAEGMWPKKLKEMCQTFMEDSGEWNLYLRWIAEVREPNFDMNNFLCRSGYYGLFRYCRNLYIPAKIEKSRYKYFYFK